MTCVSCIVSSRSEDIDSPSVKSAEEELYMDEHETIFAIGDRKPERYGSTDTEWQKIRIIMDSGSTVDVMPNDELCQVEAILCTGSRANRKARGN